MLNAIVLASIMGVAPLSPPVPVALAPAVVQPPALDWSLEGRFGFNEDGEVAAGLTYVPDCEFPLGIWVQVERLEWENTTTNNVVAMAYGRKPVKWSTATTSEQDDVKWSAGVSWRFR